MVVNPIALSPATADGFVAPAHAIVTSTCVKFVTPSTGVFTAWALTIAAATVDHYHRRAKHVSTAVHESACYYLRVATPQALA